MAVNNQPDRAVKKWLVLFNRQRLFVQDGVIPGRPGKLHDGKKHHLDILIFIRILAYHIQEYLIKIRIRTLAGQKDRPKRPHDQILGNEVHERDVEDQRIYNMIDNKNQLLVQPYDRIWGMVKCKLRPMEQFMGLVGDELVPYVIFVLKIQIERTFATPAFSTISDMAVELIPFVMKRS